MIHVVVVGKYYIGMLHFILGRLVYYHLFLLQISLFISLKFLFLFLKSFIRLFFNHFFNSEMRGPKQILLWIFLFKFEYIIVIYLNWKHLFYLKWYVSFLCHYKIQLVCLILSCYGVCLCLPQVCQGTNNLVIM